MSTLKTNSTVIAAAATLSTELVTKAQLTTALDAKANVDGQLFTKPVHTNTVALSIVSGEVVVDISRSNSFVIELTEDALLLIPTGTAGMEGTEITLVVVNTGAYELTFENAGYLFPGGIPFVNSEGTDVIRMTCHPLDPSILLCVGYSNFS